jgi:formate dehydrogenase
VQLAPPRFIAAASALEEEFRAQQAARKRLLLITKRERRSHNSWMHNAPSLRGRPEAAGNQLFVHPEDAAERKLSDGDACELRAASRSLRVTVRITDDVMSKTVALSHGWGHAEADGLRCAQATPGVNANILTADGAEALEKLSGMARLTALEVELHKAD